MTIVYGHGIEEAFMEALELPERTIGFTVRYYLDEIATVTAEYILTEESKDKFLTVLKHLVPRDVDTEA